MKVHSLIFFSISIIFLLSTCRPDREPLKFEMEYFENSFTVNPGMDPLLTHIFPFPNLATLIEQYKKTHGFTDDDIVSIVPRRGRFINRSGNESYDFINEVSVKISSRDNPGVQSEIFYHQPTFNRQGQDMTLIPNEKELRDIMLEDRFSVEVHLVRFKERPETAIETRFEMLFDVR